MHWSDHVLIHVEPTGVSTVLSGLMCANCTIRFHVCVHDQIVYRDCHTHPQCERCRLIFLLCIWEYFHSKISIIALNDYVHSMQIVAVTQFLFVLCLLLFSLWGRQCCDEEDSPSYGVFFRHHKLPHYFFWRGLVVIITDCIFISISIIPPSWKP